MNSESPLIPQGSLLEQKNQSRSRVKIAVFCVLTIHIVGLMALLVQGCKREQAQPSTDIYDLPTLDETNLPPLDPAVPEMVDLTPTNSFADTPSLPSDQTYQQTVPSEPLTPPAVTQHTIVRGDTFYDLAHHYGVTVDALKAANPTVDPNRLQINQRIMIPARTTTDVVNAPPTPPASGEILYEVKSGDNLTRIAERYKTTVRALRSANNLTTDRIIVGQKLKIPGTSDGNPPGARLASPANTRPAV